MSLKILGRKKEKKILQEALDSPEAEMISITGRRRVGKTFLVKSVYEHKISFEVSGIQGAPREEQLRNFVSRFVDFFPSSIITATPKDWLEAFILLIAHLKQKDQQEKLVVFFDELPWMATHKSGFLRGLSYFWNSWAVQQNIVVIICGSAASWMIHKVLRHKGGLHNRVTKRIQLKPFTLAETADYLQNRNVHFDHYQLILIYMVMGGIPHYLKEIKSGKNAIQNIDAICFDETGLLYDEFLSLYIALFDNAEYHVAIVRVLATTHIGMTRAELIRLTKLPEGGRITTVLDELSHSGFITSYHPFGKKKKNKLFRLTDEYSLFYLRFIEKNIQEGESIWQMLSQTSTFKTWSGYAFENICLKHLPQIKKALGITGVYSVSASFIQKGKAEEQGTQIDLILDRNDHIINLFEIKFYNTPYLITKDYAYNLREKMRIFKESTKTNKQLVFVMITTFGLKQNSYSLGLIGNDLDMEILFETV